MKNYLFLVAGTALSLASCSQIKKTDTTTTTGTPGDSTAMKSTMTSNTMYTDEAYKTRSQRIADKYAADMKVTDPAMREKIRTAYYNRSKRLGELHTKYATDTTGQSAATREAMTATDTEFKSIYTDPAQYKSYESSRTNYDETNYMSNDAGASSDLPADTSGANISNSTNRDKSSGSGSAMSGSTSDNAMSSSTNAASGTVGKSKTKLTDGTKIKVKPDGQVKIKDGDGSKMKQ
ncbi:hypothetical protein ACFQ48_10935 [Hymenobacter caeli]|uniref:Lipoprotein n=1 Tax=Hymenobacter caeli TaxID=2735894 RepID=A0ABX2FSV0_9BACT|nr:hypothetical protein [Hymenobacter caeli]NRT19923.1 hypothetical protein [Hymenobacter caeli]